MKAAKHRPYSDPADAFLDRTEPIVGDPNCLIWTGGTTANGYGQFRINGRAVRAHRYAYEREHGPMPVGSPFPELGDDS